MTNKHKRNVERSSQFRKDVRLAYKQGKDIKLLEQVIDLLADDIPLHEKHRDHALQGNWKGYRECHVSPDWLLVYKKTNTGELLLILARLASHGELNF